QPYNKITLMQNQNNFPHIPSGRCLIANEQGEILMVRRSDTSNNNPGQWELPGGKIEVDDHGFYAEEINQAIKREVREETDVKVAEMSEPLLVEAHSINDGPRKGGRSLTFVTRAQAYEGEGRVADAESSDLRWWPSGQLPSNVTQVSQLAIHRFFK
ncbi:MAG: NUDIX hydrolase, partial [Candidatus Saccharimonadales bacterium]